MWRVERAGEPLGIATDGTRNGGHSAPRSMCGITAWGELLYYGGALAPLAHTSTHTHTDVMPVILASRTS